MPWTLLIFASVSDNFLSTAGSSPWAWAIIPLTLSILTSALLRTCEINGETSSFNLVFISVEISFILADLFTNSSFKVSVISS